MAKTKSKSPVVLAAEKAGSKYRLAKLIGVSPQAVQGWEDRGQIPGVHVLKIEKLLGLPRHVLRPDLYPIEDYRGLKAAG